MSWRERAFFGLHFDIHARRDDIGLGSALSVEGLLQEMRKVGPDWVQCDCKGHTGYASYPTRVGVSPEGLAADWLAAWREASRRLGIPLVVHFSGVWDTAAIERHPSWGRIAAVGERAAFPSDLDEELRDRNLTCPRSDYTEEYMIPQMREILERYDVDGFWIDGENWASLPCSCERCAAAFRARTGLDVPGGPEDAGWSAWLAFHRESFEEHVRTCVEAVHHTKPSCTVTSNWMYSLRQPDPVRTPIDYLSGDFGWVWSASLAEIEGRFLDTRGKDWELMAWGFTSHGILGDFTFKTVPALCQEAGVVLSCGGKFLLYDQPDRNGCLVPWHMDDMAEVARFCRARTSWCRGTSSVPQAAVLHDAGSHYRRAAPLFGLGDAVHATQGAVQALLENGIAVDIVASDVFPEVIDRYPLVILAEQVPDDSGIESLLRRYVTTGGHLLVSGTDAADRFAVLLGVRASGKRVSGLYEIPGQQPVYLPYGSRTVCAPGAWSLVELRGAVEIAPLLFGRDAGSRARSSGHPAATIRRLVAGAVAAIPGDFFDSFARCHYPGLRAFLGKVLDSLSTPSLMRIEAPSSVHATLRTDGQRLLIHLVNLACHPALSPACTMVETVPPVGPITISLPVSTRPSAVFLAPTGVPVPWEFVQETLVAQVPSVGIHDILVLENAQGQSRFAAPPQSSWAASS